MSAHHLAMTRKSTGWATAVHLENDAQDFQGVAVHKGLFHDFKLSFLRGSYVVLIFYPLSFNTFAPTNLADKDVPRDPLNFRQRVNDFRDLDCEVVAVSTDSHYVQLAYSSMTEDFGDDEETEMFYFSDIDHEVSKRFGVLKEDEGISYNGLFILDRHGFVQHVVRNDLPIEFDVDETLRVLKLLKKRESTSDATE